LASASQEAMQTPVPDFYSPVAICHRFLQLYLSARQP
jgi:hypothetical protein